MSPKQSSRLTWGMIVRMGADAVLIQLGLAMAIAARVVWLITIERTRLQGDLDQLAEMFGNYVRAYADSAWPLTLISLTVFYLSGFYTYGRAYRGRYKALIVTQAVSQCYLLFAFLSYFSRGSLPLPRGALVLAWLLTVGLMVASRLWTYLWEKVVHSERSEQELTSRGRHVLVIGGAGYIGSALLPKLLDKGYHVRLLDLLLYGTEPIEHLVGHPNLEVMQGDFRHVEKVVEAMHGVDSVVHLGAIVGDPACDLDEELTIEVNLTAARMIAQVAKGWGVERLIFASTCSVYGACDETLDERSHTKPISLYGRTKLAAERGLERMSSDGFAPTILRFSTIYGLSGRTRFDLVVNLLAAKAKVDGVITVFGGDQWRPFVHVDDAALAISTVLDAPVESVCGETFNVGSDEQNYKIGEIGELIHQHVPGAELVTNDDAKDLRNYRVSFYKIRNTLGFEPKWTVAQGIQQVLEAIASGEVKDYHDAKYSNAKFLSEAGSTRIVRMQEDWTRDLHEESSQELAK